MVSVRPKAEDRRSLALEESINLIKASYDRLCW